MPYFDPPDKTQSVSIPIRRDNILARTSAIEHFGALARIAIQRGMNVKAQANAALASHYAFLMHPELRG